MSGENENEDTVESLQLQIKKLNRLLSLQEKKILRADMVISTRDRVMEMLNAERLLQEKNLINIHEENERQLTLLNAVVKATKIGLWDVGIVDNDLFHPENTFNWSNDFRKMLGYSDEIDFPNVFESWRSRLHPDDEEKAISDVTKYVADSTGTMPYDVEYRLKKKDGEYGYFRAYGEAIRGIEGGVIRLAGALMDISKEKNTLLNTERLRQEAEVASKSKSNFLANMSHEMRTPMNAIIGMTAIGKKSGEIEQKNHALNKIGDASSHLLGVINDVLDMAKIEANKLELSPVVFNFERMLNKILAVINFRVEEKQQKLIVNVDKNLPRYLIGDDQRLAQIITNLLSNAVKFTPEGGKILLDASLEGESGGKCEIRIEVKDSGIGISDEQKEKLFHAFEQAEAGISRQYGGTGLGLTISKRIVELMEGRIWIESELGEGAKFAFIVKVLRSENAEVNERLGMTDNTNDDNVIRIGEFSGKRLLVAEDIEINREIIIALLEGTGLIIDCAENGEVAVNMIEENYSKYDVIFMDVQMPVMNGHKATRRIRSFEAIQDFKTRIPIVALTANVFMSDIEECLAAGMDDHLGKPLDIDKVVEKLRKYL